jgi:hypothetical protein
MEAQQMSFKVTALVKKLGCTISREDPQSLYVDSPVGKVFKATGTHTITDSWHRGFKPDYADIFERMSDGLEDCEDPECDNCHPTEETLADAQDDTVKKVGS